MVFKAFDGTWFFLSISPKSNHQATDEKMRAPVLSVRLVACKLDLLLVTLLAVTVAYCSCESVTPGGFPTCKYAVQDWGFIKSGAEVYQSGCFTEGQHGLKWFWSVKGLENTIQRHLKRLLVR